MGRYVSTILPFVLVGSSLLASCGNDPPAAVPLPAVPPQLIADPATTAAMKDPKFADYRARVRALRAASKAMSEYLSSIGGKPKDDAQRSRYTALDEAIANKKEAVGEVMADPAWTEADRKVLRVLFAAPESVLND